MTLAEPVGKNCAPAGGKLARTRKIRHAACDFTAEAALVAVLRRLGVLRFCLGTLYPGVSLPPPAFHLIEDRDTFAKDSRGVDASGPRRKALPPFFALEPPEVPQDKVEGKIRRAQALQNVRALLSGILFFQIFLDWARIK